MAFPVDASLKVQANAHRHKYLESVCVCVWQGSRGERRGKKEKVVSVVLEYLSLDFVCCILCFSSAPPGSFGN